MTTWLQKTMFSGNYFSSSSDNYCKKRFITSVLKKKLCLTNLCYFWLRIKKSRNVQCNNSVIYGHLWPYLVWLIHQNCFKISFLYNQEEEFQKFFVVAYLWFLRCLWHQKCHLSNTPTVLHGVNTFLEKTQCLKSTQNVSFYVE